VSQDDSLAICRPSGCTVVSGIVIIGVCNHSQMRTSKCTCLIFGVSLGLDHGDTFALVLLFPDLFYCYM